MTDALRNLAWREQASLEKQAYRRGVLHTVVAVLGILLGIALLT